MFKLACCASIYTSLMLLIPLIDSVSRGYMINTQTTLSDIQVTTLAARISQLSAQAAASGRVYTSAGFNNPVPLYWYAQLLEDGYRELRVSGSEIVDTFEIVSVTFSTSPSAQVANSGFIYRITPWLAIDKPSKPFP